MCVSKQLFNSVSAFVEKTLDATYHTNPDLEKMYVRDVSDAPTLLHSCYRDFKDFSNIEKSTRDIWEYLDFNGDKQTVYLFRVYMGAHIDSQTLEAWYFCPNISNEGGSWACLSSVNYNFGGDTPCPSIILNDVHAAIVATLVYYARHHYNETKMKHASIKAASDPRIQVGAVINNIRISMDKYSKVVVEAMMPDSRGHQMCTVHLSKRGSKKRWSAEIDAASLIHAIEIRDKEMAIQAQDKAIVSDSMNNQSRQSTMF